MEKENPLEKSAKAKERGNYDSECEHCQFLADDALYSPSGDYKCMIQEFRHGEYNQNLDYQPCNQTDHLTCPVYIRAHPKEKK